MFLINMGNTNQDCLNLEAEAMRKSLKEVQAIVQIMVNEVNLEITTTEGIAITIDKEVEADLEVEKENHILITPSNLILTIIGTIVNLVIHMMTNEVDKVDHHTMDQLEVATALIILMVDQIEDER